MQQIPLQTIPNQTLEYIDEANNQWQITINYVQEIMVFSFTLNGVLLTENVTGITNGILIPYKYLSPSINFVLTSQNQQIPDYTQFNVTQFLIELNSSDLSALSSNFLDQPLITQDMFDPRGQLPLRFKPQGYTVAP